MPKILSHLGLEPFKFDAKLLALKNRPGFDNGDGTFSNYSLPLTEANRDFIRAWTAAEAEWLEEAFPRIFEEAK